MESISKWLVPGFLWRLDKYLLEQRPLMWYSGAHWVLFYGLLGGLLLFGVGMFYPVHWVKRELINSEYINLDQWVVDPIQPIVFSNDTLHIFTLLFVLAIASFWMYRQFHLRQFFYQMQYTLLFLLIYTCCFWVLCGVSAAAFRLGTIVKTAWFWMPEKDLQSFKKSNIYPYGFTPLPADTLGIIPVDTLAFFHSREKAFKHIWKEEETLLIHRYNNMIFWEKLLKKLDETYPELDESNSYMLDQLYGLHLLDWSYQLWYPENRPGLLDQSYESDPSYKLYLSYRSNRWDLLYNSDEWYRSDDSDRLAMSDQLLQSAYYRLSMKRVTNPKAFNYNLINYNDTLNTFPLVIIPSLPNQIEDAIRSVEHARQFLRHGISLYFFHLPYYLLFLSILLFLLPWISARSLLQLGGMVVCLYLLLLLLGWVLTESIGRWVIVAAFLILPVTGFLLQLWMLLKQKQGQLFRFSVNIVFLGLLLTLMFALFGVSNFILFDIAFYGVQLIGLLAACVAPYVNAMPKTR